MRWKGYDWITRCSGASALGAGSGSSGVTPQHDRQAAAAAAVGLPGGGGTPGSQEKLSLAQTRPVRARAGIDSPKTPPPRSRGAETTRKRERERDVETMGGNSTTRVLQSDLTLTRVRLDLPGMVAAPVAEGFAEGSGAVATQAAESFAQGGWRDRCIYIYI